MSFSRIPKALTISSWSSFPAGAGSDFGRSAWTAPVRGGARQTATIAPASPMRIARLTQAHSFHFGPKRFSKIVVSGLCLPNVIEAADGSSSGRPDWTPTVSVTHSHTSAGRPTGAYVASGSATRVAAGVQAQAPPPSSHHFRSDPPASSLSPSNRSPPAPRPDPAGGLTAAARPCE